MGIRRWIAACILMMIFVVLCSGCIGTKTPPVSRPPAPSIFVDYHRSGGIAGFNDRLVIFGNGMTVISSRSGNREIVLNQSEVDRITQLFDQAQFSLLDTNYPAPHGGGADLIKYSISYHSKTVTTEDTAIPAALQPLIDEMNRILSSGVANKQATRTPA